MSIEKRIHVKGTAWLQNRINATIKHKSKGSASVGVCDRDPKGELPPMAAILKQNALR